MKYDVVIVGAGPAGLFTAYELVDENLNVLIIEKGKPVRKRKCPMEETGKCTNCQPCDIMSGEGGAGTFSDGTLNLRPDIGGDLSKFTNNRNYANELVWYVDGVFQKFGASSEIYGDDNEKIKFLKKKAISAGITFIDIPQRHIGTDKAPLVIQNFVTYLKKKGIKFMLNTDVIDLDISDGICRGVKLKNKTIDATKIVISPGRVGAQWVEQIVKKYNIRAKYAPVDVGVRIEVPAIILNDITEINRDPKFHIRTSSYDDFVRTFCTNARGFVVKENYDGFVGVNGHAYKTKESENTNFALLVNIALTHPVENACIYGRSIAALATTIGGGKPIIQRMADVRRQRRSTWRKIKINPVENTLKDVTPGDISMAMPHRIVTDILEGLDKLDLVLPGVAADSTLLYAPEVKYYGMEILVDENMCTSVKNLYAAGDGAGLSRDIINASATGVLVGRKIREML